MKSTFETSEDQNYTRNECSRVQVLNQSVGDALCDLLAVEAVLAARKMTIEDWDLMYEDMPSRQGKVKVKDRWETTLETSEDGNYTRNE